MITHGSSPRPWGVGSPAILHLFLFGRIVYEAFDVVPHLVGSATVGKEVRPRDIDVRLMLPNADYIERIGPIAECGKNGTRWAALTMAFSALGSQMTGLLVDFQIQPYVIADVYNSGACIALVDVGAPGDSAAAGRGE